MELENQINRMKNFQLRFYELYSHNKNKINRNKNNAKKNIIRKKFHLEKKEKSIIKEKDNINQNKEIIKDINKTYDDSKKINNFFMNDKLLPCQEKDNCFQYEINNLLSSTDDFSIKEENHQNISNLYSQKINLYDNNSLYTKSMIEIENTLFANNIETTLILFNIYEKHILNVSDEL